MKEKLLCAAKYLFSLLIVFLSVFTMRSAAYALSGVAELIFIFALSDILIRKSKKFGWLNSVLLLLFNVQYLILFFGGSYLTLVMLENINSIQDLGGKALIYGVGAVLVPVASFLPVTPLLPDKKKLSGAALAAAFVAEGISLFVTGAAYSPFAALYGIYGQWEMKQALYGDTEPAAAEPAAFVQGDEERKESASKDAAGHRAPEEKEEQKEQATEDGDTQTESAMTGELPQIELFEKGERTVAADYSCNISRPNVILIFTEGLSENIVTDGRAIMPNVARMQNNSLNFTNYYNHTFATYRGLIGQLYSGHQRDDGDRNYLVSLQDVLKEQGYRTAIINTEPWNETFDAYLRSMNFDDVFADGSLCDGAIGAYSDKTAYEYLFYVASAYESELEQPFFLVIYTFGTHVSLDSTDQKYGEGTDRVLNRFYDVDYQFGNFINRFNDSPLASDTIVVFTADHATYADQDFRAAFPKYKRNCSDADEIPFFIYSAAGPTGQVNAGGRNSLDMAPTLLHYLGMEAPEYFLGDSLFYEKTEGLRMDTFFYDPTYMIYTGDDSVKTPDSDTQKMLIDALRRYFLVSTKQPE